MAAPVAPVNALGVSPTPAPIFGGPAQPPVFPIDIIGGADPAGYRDAAGNVSVPLAGTIVAGAGPNFGDPFSGTEFHSSAGPDPNNPADVDQAQALVDSNFWNALQRVRLIGNRASALYETSYDFRVAIMDKIQILRRQIYYIRAVISALEAGYGPAAVGAQIRAALRDDRQKVTEALAPINLDLLRALVQLLDDPALSAPDVMGALHDALDAFNNELSRLVLLLPAGAMGQDPALHNPAFPLQPGSPLNIGGWQSAGPVGENVAAPLAGAAPYAGGIAAAAPAVVPAGVAGIGGVGAGAVGGPNPYNVRGGHRRRSRGGWTPKNQKKKHKKHKTKKHKKHKKHKKKHKKHKTKHKKRRRRRTRRR